MDGIESMLNFARAMQLESGSKLPLFRFMLMVPRTFWLCM